MLVLINNFMNKYVASVRLKGQTVKIAVFADCPIHARLILQYQFGMNSIVSSPVPIKEANTIKPMNPEQARIKSMQDRVKKDQAAVKAERARRKIHHAQQQITKAINPQRPLGNSWKIKAYFLNSSE